MSTQIYFVVIIKDLTKTLPKMKKFKENRNLSKFKTFMKTKDTNNIKKILKSGIIMNKMF